MQNFLTPFNMGGCDTFKNFADFLDYEVEKLSRNKTTIYTISGDVYRELLGRFLKKGADLFYETIKSILELESITEVRFFPNGEDEANFVRDELRMFAITLNDEQRNKLKFICKTLEFDEMPKWIPLLPLNENGDVIDSDIIHRRIQNRYITFKNFTDSEQ